MGLECVLLTILNAEGTGVQRKAPYYGMHQLNTCHDLTLNIPSLARQRCLPSWDPRRPPWFFFVISQLFDAVDYSNYVFFCGGFLKL